MTGFDTVFQYVFYRENDFKYCFIYDNIYREICVFKLSNGR